MRTLVLLLTLTGFVIPALGAKRVAVDQLEQTLAAAHSLQDAEVARQLSDLELTERLSTAKLDRLKAELPGEKSRQALMILADASAFLDPPATEISNQPAPDLATQRKILALTVNYVTQTLHQLPSFFATRVTSSFEDTPVVQRPCASISSGCPASTNQPIRLVGDSNVTVTFREGREVVEKSNFDPRVRSLTTSGVFGPILGTVLVDAVRSKLAWSHWELSPTGLQAVFSYDVSKENSHYTVTYDSLPTDPECNATPQTFSKVVAYHGEMAIDPASGTILRLMLLADLKPDEFAPASSGIVVEYGQVSIGGKPYFLPVRSVTSSLAHSLQTSWTGGRQGCPLLAVTPGLQTSLNDVAFENYHVFRSDAKVLTESEAARLESQPSPTPNGNGSKQAEEANASSLAAVTPVTSLPQSNSQAVSSVSAAADSSNPPAPESQPAPQDASNTASSAPAPAPVAAPPASNLPPPPATENAASSANIPVFRTTARQVLVDVVVGKKNGDPVPDLPKSDFFVNENGKPQAIDFFEEHSAAASSPVAQPIMPPMPPGAVTNVPAAPPSAALYVFLLDALNSEPQDQVFVRQQVLSYLHKMDSGTQVAVFSLGSSLHLLQGFTSDPAMLLAAVSRKEAERSGMAQNRSDDADDAGTIATLQAMSASPAAIVALQAAQANAHAYSFGARASMTFEALNALARYLEGIPGRKNLIWFASSFPVVLFPTPAQLDQLKNNPNLPGYMNHVQQTANLFTLSKVAVYPVSGAGVMNSNIGLPDSADAGSAGGAGHFGTAAAPTASLTGEAMNSASALAAMEQLASSTGGRAFTTNDIDSALRKIVHDSDVYYTVGYAPADSATDGSFRRIDVKVASGKYKLDYRQGYNASESSAVPTEDPIAPLLQLGLPNASGILYGASAAPSIVHGSEPAGQNPHVKGPVTRYTVSFTIRAEDVFFSEAPNGERIANLLIGIKAYARDGSALNWQATREATELSPTSMHPSSRQASQSRWISTCPPTLQPS